VERDSSADRAACGRKDIAGILVDTVACVHKMEVLVALEVDKPHRHVTVAVNEIPESQRLDDEKQ